MAAAPIKLKFKFKLRCNVIEQVVPKAFARGRADESKACVAPYMREKL